MILFNCPKNISIRAGDTYAALKDCCCALKLDPHQLKPFHRLVRCFQILGWAAAAQDALENLKKTFPDLLNSASVRSLEKNLRTSPTILQQPETVNETEEEGSEGPEQQEQQEQTAQGEGLDVVQNGDI